MPLEEDIALAYHADYYTHDDTSAPLTWYRRGYRWLKRGYLSWRYGYQRDSTTGWQRLLGLSLWLHPRRRLDIDTSVMHLPFRPGGRLLEVGCGAGLTLKTLSDLGWDVEGVDFDPRAVANARGRGLKVRQGSLEAQGFDESSFHAIVLSHLIEHVHDPRALLAECRRVLHPEGTLVLLTPNADSLGHRIFRESWFHLDPPRHVVLLNPRNLHRLAEDAGLRVARIETRRREAWLIWRCSRQVRALGRAMPFERRTLAERAGGLLYEAMEAALLVARPLAGEEMLLVAGHGPRPTVRPAARRAAPSPSARVDASSPREADGVALEGGPRE